MVRTVQRWNRARWLFWPVLAHSCRSSRNEKLPSDAPLWALGCIEEVSSLKRHEMLRLIGPVQSLAKKLSSFMDMIVSHSSSYSPTIDRSRARTKAEDVSFGIQNYATDHRRSAVCLVRRDGPVLPDQTDARQEAEMQTRCELFSLQPPTATRTSTTIIGGIGHQGCAAFALLCCRDWSRPRC